MRPNFLVLGAAKCGTTSLCTWVGRHPDVMISTPKEPVFFELEYSKGLDYYSETYFKEWDGERAIGEGRVYNLFLPFVPERIRGALPNARLVAILRDPVERAHSHWWHRVTRGYEQRPFEEAVSEELVSLRDGREFKLKLNETLWRSNVFPGAASHHTADLKHVPYVEMGHYGLQLSRYFAIFPREQIRVVFLRDLRERREEVVRGLWDFLQVDPSQAVPEDPPKNIAKDEVKGSLAFRLERFGWATGLHQVVPKVVRSIIRKALPSQSAEKPPISRELERRLRKHYESLDTDISQLIGQAPQWSGGRE